MSTDLSTETALPDASAGHAADHQRELDIDGVPLRDGKKIDLKQILGHTPQIDDEEEDSSAAAGGAGVSGADGLRSRDDPTLTAELIRSQFEPVDDDDLVPYDDDDDAVDVDDTQNDWPTSGRRKRRSSLKKLLRMPSEPLASVDDEGSGSGSPLSPDEHGRKAVRFADALGLGLADVRDLINADEPPQVPASALRDLRLRRRKRSRSQLTYVLDFEQPAADPGFITRVLTDKVALENCIARNDVAGDGTSGGDQLLISGVVRVANVAFDKRVVVRYTVDGWSSTPTAGPAAAPGSGGGTIESEASYLPGSNDGATDRFAFAFRPPTGSVGSPGSRLEFVVSFEAAGTTYWDNNGGQNYGVDCRAAERCTGSSLSESEMDATAGGGGV